MLFPVVSQSLQHLAAQGAVAAYLAVDGVGIYATATGRQISAVDSSEFHFVPGTTLVWAEDVGLIDLTTGELLRRVPAGSAPPVVGDGLLALNHAAEGCTVYGVTGVQTSTLNDPLAG